MDATCRTQLNLPLTYHETRAAKLERLLSGELAKSVKRASEISFTAEAAERAEAVAKETASVR